jgi:hypothetical protein
MEDKIFGALIEQSIALFLRLLKHLFCLYCKAADNDYIDSFKILADIKSLRQYKDMEQNSSQEFKEAIEKLHDLIAKRIASIKPRYKNDEEVYILETIDEILISDILAELRSDKDWIVKKKNLIPMLFCIHNLEKLFECICPSNVRKINQSSNTPSRPPSWCYLTIGVVPAIIFVISSPAKPIGILSFLNSKVHALFNHTLHKSPPIIQCLSSDETSKIADQMVKKHLMDSFDDPGFQQVLGLENEDISYFKDKIGIDTSSELGAKDLKKLIKYIESPEIHNKKDSLKTKLERVKPLLDIFQNNEDLKRNSSNTKLYHYQVAVMVPFGPDKTYPHDGPLPWGLGILRGVDIAQRIILKESKKAETEVVAVPEVVIVKDNFSAFMTGSGITSQKLSHFLANGIYNNKKFLGLVGSLQQLDSSYRCYDAYKLPVLTNEISRPIGNEFEFIQSLLPGKDIFSQKIVSMLKDGSSDKLTVFYASNDPSSRDIGQAICSYIKAPTQRENIRFRDCVNKDILDESFEKELKNNLSDTEALLMFNLLNDNSTKVQRIIKVYKEINRKGGTIYVGNDFVDQDLIQDMKREVSSTDPRISIKRISPWDWRAGKVKQSHNFEELLKDYGRNKKSYNWLVINSINSMLLFNDLTNSKVSDYKHSHDLAEDKIRNSVGIMISGLSSFELKGGIPDKFKINTKDNQVFHDDFVVCLVDILKEEEDSEAQCD